MRESLWRLVLTLAVVGGTALEAQSSRPQAVVTPVVDTARLTPGAEVRLSLKVKLPANVHVQADKPRDPLLIPTVLTIDALKDITVTEIAYPPAMDLKQAGQKEPLAVFGSEFTVRVRAKLAADAGPGDVIVPARLRYQACDENTCYPPTKADIKWSLRVGPENTKGL